MCGNSDTHPEVYLYDVKLPESPTTYDADSSHRATGSIPKALHINDYFLMGAHYADVRESAFEVAEVAVWQEKLEGEDLRIVSEMMATRMRE